MIFHHTTACSPHMPLSPSLFYMFCRHQCNPVDCPSPESELEERDPSPHSSLVLDRRERWTVVSFFWSPATTARASFAVAFVPLNPAPPPRRPSNDQRSTAMAWVDGCAGAATRLHKRARDAVTFAISNRKRLVCYCCSSWWRGIIFFIEWW